MELEKQFKSLVWCKADWPFPDMSEKENDLLKQCVDTPQAEVSNDIKEVIARSKAFPIPFPIDTVRLDKLQVRRPIEKLKNNVVSTYPLIHERVLLLMTHFLIYKREFGSNVEKDFYKYMSVPDLIDRILTKRAITFMGPADKYMLMTGEKGSMFIGLPPKDRKAVKEQHFKGVEGWTSVGADNQRPPLLLDSCLSYDEMKLSAMVFVSGHTECINDGERRNSGVVNEEDIEKDAVIIGAIGPRFQRHFRMDFEDIIVSKEQNVPENGYGEDNTLCKGTVQTAKRMWRKLWSDFYQVPSYTYEELTSLVNTQTKKDTKLMYTERYVRLPKNDFIFDNEIYYKRISIIAETVLIEGNARAKDAGKHAYVNVIGCGLGVWKISKHQVDMYVLIFFERVRRLLHCYMLQHVADVNFSYINPSKPLLAMFTKTSSRGKDTEVKIFIEYKQHPRGGINVHIKIREPSSRLEGEDEGKLLVMMYPWDSNAHPGNEFWIGKLRSSGDPAAACSTQVSELHNAHINRAVCASRTRVASATGLAVLADHCRQRDN